MSKPLPPGIRDAHLHIAQVARLRTGNAPPHYDLFQAQALSFRRQFVHNILQLLGLESERRPRIKENPVPIKALMERAPRLEEPDARQRLRQHAFQMGKLYDPPRLIPHRSQIAHFRTNEEPLILRVVVGDRMEKVDIFHRRQPFNSKVVKPPQAEPFAHHRMESAVELLLFIGVFARRAIGEMLRAAQAPAVAGTGDDRDQAPNGARKAGLVEQGVDFLLRRLRIARQAAGAKGNNPELRRGLRGTSLIQGSIACAASRAPKFRNRRRKGERAYPFHRIQPTHSTARPAPRERKFRSFWMR